MLLVLTSGANELALDLSNPILTGVDLRGGARRPQRNMHLRISLLYRASAQKKTRRRRKNILRKEMVNHTIWPPNGGLHESP